MSLGTPTHQTPEELQREEQMDMIAKAAVTAGICGSMVYFLVPRGQEYVSVNQGLIGQYLGTAWMPLAGAGAGALMSVTSDVLHQAILSHIHTSEKWSNTAGAALGALTAAGGSYAGFRAMDPRFVQEQGVGPMRIMAIGVGSEIAGQMAYNNLIKPMLASTS